MIIHYYLLAWCSYGLYQEKPAVFAPEDADEMLLRHYHFHQAENGRYYKFLTEQEYDIIAKNASANIFSLTSETFSPTDKSPAKSSFMKVSTANWLCIGSVLAFLIGIVPLLIPLYSEPGLIILITPPLMWVTALILAVIVRVRCPESLFGKILLIVYIILIVLAVIAVMLFIAACNAAWDVCFNCECIGSNMS